MKIISNMIVYLLELFGYNLQGEYLGELEGGHLDLEGCTVGLLQSTSSVVTMAIYPPDEHFPPLEMGSNSREEIMEWLEAVKIAAKKKGLEKREPEVISSTMSDIIAYCVAVKYQGGKCLCVSPPHTCTTPICVYTCLGSKYYHMTSLVESKVESLLNDQVFLRQVACSELYTQLT